MSAVVPRKTLEQLAEWLGGSADSIAVTGWRPSIQRYAMLDWSNGRGTLRYSEADVESGGLGFVPNLVERRDSRTSTPKRAVGAPKVPGQQGSGSRPSSPISMPRQGPVLIYCATTPWAQSVAKELMQRGGWLNSRTNRHRTRSTSKHSLVCCCREWLGSDHEVVQMLDRGIAFHHGRLPEAVREAIEHDIRRRNLDVLVATSTLAQGVNLPFRTVIIHSARRYDEERAGTTRLPARDYWNIAGRAGHAGQETEGTVIHIVAGWQDAQDYLYYEARRGSVEELESALLGILRDLIDNRISSEDAAEKLDSDLLALLVEEDSAILDADLLESTIGSTLFAIQAAELDLPTQRLVSVIHSTVRSIAATVQDPAASPCVRVYGTVSRSCEAIRNHIEENSAGISAVLQGAESDRAVVLENLLDGIVRLRG